MIAVSFLLVSFSVAAVSQPIAWMAGPVIPEVTLQDQDGKSWRLDELVKGRSVVVNFFFTGCSAICPTQTLHVAEIGKALQQESSHFKSQPLILSIALDPLGDTPESMKQFANHLGVTPGEQSNWLMLTGQANDLEKVWNSFDQLSDSPEQHSAIVWIGQPQNGRWTRASSLSPVDQIVAIVAEPET
jgi:cytochrome oxidase Cu insertion factor (SCO1/SenC/PrrC family)